MSDEWGALARQYGRRSVMNLAITDAALDVETARQLPILSGLIAGQLHGHERTALDFGCGAGRFTIALSRVIQGRAVGFDPCEGLITAAPGHINVDYHTSDTEAFFSECQRNETTFDLILAFGVMGAPGLDTEAVADGLISLLSNGGLLVVADHMPSTIPSGKWWRFRHSGFYQDLFSRHGITLECVGELQQLTETITVLAGRLS